LGDDAGWHYRAPGERGFARAELDGRLVSVITGVNTFILGFAERTGLAHGAVDEPAQVVGVTRRWLEGADLTSLKSAYPFVEFTELQLGYERGDARETQWRILLADGNEMYREVIALAAADPSIRCRFPAVGHNLLFFADEFSSRPMASVIFYLEGTYQLYIPGNDSAVVVGDVETVVSRLSSVLSEPHEPVGG
jgi:hypothetical protein